MGDVSFRIVEEATSGRGIAECTSRFCEVGQSVELTLPCRNGGVCAPESNAFSCSCPLGFGGSLCTNGKP